ncbi:MAG TPA: hypothetical protein DCX08_01995 [Porticoccaceae bacterium]|jgi:carbonic anhydrase|nr:hypothetical protein [Porticoccaceae bacterium]
MSDDHLDVNIAPIVDANSYYYKTFSQLVLDVLPSRRLSILTCMDCPMELNKFANLKDVEAYIVQAATGCGTDKAIDSLVTFHTFLDTIAWSAIYHTGYGMSSVMDEKIGQLLPDDLETVALHEGNHVNPVRASTEKPEPRSDMAKSIKWCTFSNLTESVTTRELH